MIYLKIYTLNICNINGKVWIRSVGAAIISLYYFSPSVLHLPNELVLSHLFRFKYIIYNKYIFIYICIPKHTYIHRPDSTSKKSHKWMWTYIVFKLARKVSHIYKYINWNEYCKYIKTFLKITWKRFIAKGWYYVFI